MSANRPPSLAFSPSGGARTHHSAVSHASSSHRSKQQQQQAAAGSSPAAAAAAAAAAPSSGLLPRSVPLKFHTQDYVNAIVREDDQNFIFVCHGVPWCVPAQSTLENFERLRETSGKRGGLRVFLLNDDDDRDFADSRKLVVGSPVVEAWYKGEPLTFARPGWAPLPFLVGPVNAEQLTALLEACQSAIDDEHAVDCSQFMVEAFFD